MVFAAPEFIVSEAVQMFHQVEIAAELQHRVLTDRMMRGEEGSEIQTRHEGVSWVGMVQKRGRAGNIRPIVQRRSRFSKYPDDMWSGQAGGGQYFQSRR
jgi:uncharacterized caspase-like protein